MSCACSHSSGRSAPGGLPERGGRGRRSRGSAPRGAATPRRSRPRSEQPARRLHERLHAHVAAAAQRVEQPATRATSSGALDLRHHERPEPLPPRLSAAHVVLEPGLRAAFTRTATGALELAARRAAPPPARAPRPWPRAPPRPRGRSPPRRREQRAAFASIALRRAGHRQARAPGLSCTNTNRGAHAPRGRNSRFTGRGGRRWQTRRQCLRSEAIGVAVWCFLVALAGGAVGLVLGNLRLPVVLLVASSPAVGRRRQHRGLRGRRLRGRRSATCAPAAINWRLFGWMAPPSVAGALAGGYLAGELPESALLLAIAAVLLYSGLDLLRWEPPGAPARRPRATPGALDIRAAVLSRARDRPARRPRGADPRRPADARAAQAGRRGARRAPWAPTSRSACSWARPAWWATCPRPRPTGTCSRSERRRRCPGALLGARLTGRLSERQLVRAIGAALLVAGAAARGAGGDLAG